VFTEPEINYTLPIGSILNERYFIGKILGEGGFGITYLGYDTKLEMKVAIKEYYPDGYANREHTTTAHTVYSYTGEKSEFFNHGIERFIKEAKRLSKFSGQPGVVNVRDYFSENNTAYIVMEFVEGTSLKNVLMQHGKISEKSALEFMEPIIKTLAKIHKAGIIHRDISPDNIMLEPDGKAVLIDFGAATETEAEKKSTVAMVKKNFAPEEQYDDNYDRQGTWTDVYSMCATLYNILQGVPPIDVLSRLRGDKLAEFKANISAATKKAIMHGLEISAEERIKTMDELLEELHGKTAETTVVTNSVTEFSETAPAEDVGVTVFTPEKTAFISQEEIKTTPVKRSKKPLIVISAVAAVLVIGIMIPIITFNDKVPEKIETQNDVVTKIPKETESTAQSSTYTDITGNFTDSNFKAAIRDALGLSDNDPITKEAIEKVKILNVSNENITSLAGIENFTALIDLNCSLNNITSLPKLPSTLTDLNCSYNELTSIKELPLSLKTLKCNGNRISTLPKLPNGLKQLRCNENQLLSLPDFPSQLTELSVNQNSLSEIPALPLSLKELSVADNPKLDINSIVFTDGTAAKKRAENKELDFKY
jgi:serine/threonine protein kinase